MIKILHITPHLGGGVGRALASLCAGNKLELNSKISHSFICLERPEKDQFVNEIVSLGVEIFVEPRLDEIKRLIESSDIVQIEWWNHPLTLFILSKLQDMPMRLIIWCHQSGLGNTAIPIKLVKLANRFLLTSECSYEVKELYDYKKSSPNSIEVISSGAGFERLPHPDKRVIKNHNFELGYVGTLSFSKLHPQFISFISFLPPNTKVKIFGDITNKDALENDCRSIGRPGLLEFQGYSTNIYEELKKLDILLYLLNPEHYGTAEIVLLEAMAMGVVPIVMNNSAEKLIVEDGINGFVINTRLDLIDKYNFLRQNPSILLEMSRRAEQNVRDKYALPRLQSKFSNQYHSVMNEKKRNIDFKEAIGKNPSEWFLSCNHFKKKDPLSKNFQQEYLDKTKGSIYHYLKYFHEDEGLMKIAQSFGVS